MKTIKAVKIFLISSMILTCTGIVYSQTNFRADSFDSHNTEIEISNKILGHHFKTNQIQTGYTDISSIAPENDKQKDPVLGAVLSGLIPGAGQVYAKSYIKAAIFAAIEAGLWIAYGIYQGKGNDQTEYYQGYADGNWDVRRYAEWLVQQNFQGSSGINPNEPDVNVLRGQINICESQNFSHTLPPYGDQQYYEVIGKYQNFLKGWSTAIGKDINKNNYGTYQLDQVDYYMGERELANDYYSYGTTSLMIVILNHVVSGIDGVLSVNSYNKKLSAKGNIGFVRDYSLKTGKYAISPQAHITITF